MRSFDRWINRGAVSVLDLGLYRIIFGVLTLFTLPDILWLADLPDAMVDPPLGPFRLISSIPDLWVLVVIELALAFSLATLTVGLWTRISSWVVSLLQVVVYGLTYSLGIIDHSILIAVAPALLSFSGWGRTRSIDAVRTGNSAEPLEAPQWPQRLLALLIGVAIATAGVAKIATGWLSPDSQAAIGYVFQYHRAPGDPIALALVNLNGTPLGELMDWVVVLLELSILVSVLSWRAFRIGLASLAVFHLAVAVSMEIFFAWNVIVYGAYVSWTRLRIPAKAVVCGRRLALQASRSYALTILALAGLGFGASALAGESISFRSAIILAIGALFGISYLVWRVTTVLLRRYVRA